ncbi:hypothetical protein BJV78DRAFT_242141 [Lactifluus subvellereus]|nr:hypothetical protein BJV78DRAFT_242141 [Lactifluus subvellereus]
MLGHSFIGAGANPVSDAGASPYLSQPFLHDGQMSCVPPYVPAGSHSPQVGAEAYPAGCHPLIQSTSTGPPPSPQFNPVTSAPYTSSKSTGSTLRGSEDFRSVLVIATKEAMCTDHVMATNWTKDEFNVTSDPSYQYGPSITCFPSIRSQQSGANHLYALPEAMPQGQATLTCVHKTTSAFTVPLTHSRIPTFPL